MKNISLSNQILEGLLLLKQQQPTWEEGDDRRTHGICVNLKNILNEESLTDYSMSYLLKVFKDWPEFSGSVIHPIQDATFPPNVAYRMFMDKWSGEYGESRKRLLDFLIVRLQQDGEYETYQV